jgi:hypothetical protein
LDATPHVNIKTNINDRADLDSLANFNHDVTIGVGH